MAEEHQKERMMDRIRRVRSTAPEAEAEEEEVLDDNEIAETPDDMDRIEKQYRDRAVTPLKAIRAFCVLCVGIQPKMVSKCTAPNCVLYPYRMGKNPFQKHGEGSKTLQKRK